MTDKPVILVDMDGVLADFDKATNEFLDNHPENIPLIRRDQFYYHHNYPDQRHRDIITSLYTTRHFFRNLPVIEGAIEGWQRIINLGYQPRICSSPLRANKWCKEEKIAWLGEHLGKSVSDNAIIDKQKYLYDGIALIDDRPELEGSDKATWSHVVFDASYNQNSSANLRLMNWHDPNLEEILAFANDIYQKQHR